MQARGFDSLPEAVSLGETIRAYLQRRPAASPEEIARWMALSRRIVVARPLIVATMAAIKTG